MLFLIIIIAAVLAVSYWAYLQAFYLPENKRGQVLPMSGEQYKKCAAQTEALTAQMRVLDYEPISIISRDGLRLSGRYYHVSDNGPLYIQFHGYKGDPVRDMCGGNKISRNSGCSAIVVDQRAHGKSEGKSITFGVKERYDCLDWINYAVDRFGSGRQIVLSGVSMGAATVIMAADLELPKNVIGIIADCPYSSPKDILVKVSGQMGYPKALTWPFIRLGAMLFARFDPLSASAENAAKNAKVPILIIHGDDDRFVPCDMSKKIYNANPKMVRLEIFPAAGHGLSFMTDEERYTKHSLQFVSECLNNNQISNNSH